MLNLIIQTEGFDPYIIEGIDHFNSRVHPGLSLTSSDNVNGSVTRFETNVKAAAMKNDLLQDLASYLQSSNFTLTVKKVEAIDNGVEESEVYSDIFTEFTNLSLVGDMSGECYYRLVWSKENTATE